MQPSLLTRLLGTFSLIGLVSACDPEASATDTPRPALSVTITQPSMADWPIKVTANGTIEPWQEAIIGTTVQGLTLEKVNADVGDIVKAGQVLAIFDDDPVKIDVEQARAALLQTQANVEVTHADAERARALAGSGAISDQVVTQLITAEKTARAQVRAAQAALAAQQLRLSRTVVKAPDDGIISTRAATVGAVLGQGSELFRMIRQGRLEWRGELTDTELEKVTPGSTAMLTLSDGRTVAGTVRMVAPTINTRTRTGIAYVDLPYDAGLRPGVFARGEFDLGQSTAVTLPLKAIVIRNAFSYVFALDKNAKVTELKIQTGRRIGDRMEITGGLTPEVRIVEDGAGFLNHGDTVRVVDALPATTPGASQTDKAAAAQ